MLERIAGFVNEIAAEIGIEAVAEPMRILAEVTQFLVLLAIVWAVAIGFGKRRGFVANMLSERETRVAARLEGASHAEKSLADAKHEAAATTRSGRAQARELIAHAREECIQIEKAAHEETDIECRRIEERAQSALATEQQEMLLELREQLVELVSSATRSIMNEKLTITEQRALIENTIVGSMSASAGDDARIEAMAASSAPREA